MPKVYVIQEQPNHDLAPAMSFGDIVTLLPPGDTNFSYEFTVDKLREDLGNIALEDYLLLTGDPVAIGLATSIVSEYLGGHLQLLKWMRRERVYLPIKIRVN